MKGSLHTDQFMHAILRKENHLRTDRLLSHCMLISLPTYSRGASSSAMRRSTSPRTSIRRRTSSRTRSSLPGPSASSQPKVAILSAVEVVRTKMPSTMEAAALGEDGGPQSDRRRHRRWTARSRYRRRRRVGANQGGQVAGRGPCRHSDRTRHRRRQHDVQGAVVHERRPGRRHRHGGEGAGDSDQPLGQRRGTRMFSTALAVLFADATARDPTLLHPATSE